MIDVAANGKLQILDGALLCRGSRAGDGTWTFIGSWSGKELSPGEIVGVLFPNLPFDPKESLPSIAFPSVEATIVLGESCDFACASSVDWPTPFNIPVGLKIDNLNMAFQRSLASGSPPSFIQASGLFGIGGTHFRVFIYFTHGSPILLIVDNIPTLTLNTMLDQFGFSLPGNFLDLSFANSRIYYSPNGGNAGVTLTPPIVPIVQGLNISSQVTLRLADVTFPIDLSIAVISGNGISASGSLDRPVDIASFLQITGANPTYSFGPALSLVTLNNQNNFSLKCGIKFLGEEFGQTGITISNQAGKTQMTATLSFAGSIGPFNNPNLSMTYLEGKGFEITNWPGFTVGNLPLDFAKLLQEINNNAGCGDIVDFVLNETVKTEFTIGPRFTTTKPTNISPLAAGQFYLVLNGFYTISAAGLVVCSLKLPELAVSFDTPADFSFDTIVSKVGDTILANGVQVVEQLYKDKAALGKFIAVFVSQDVAKKLLQELCDALKGLLNNFLEAAGNFGSGVLGALGAASTAFAGLGGGCGGGGGGLGTLTGLSPNIQPLPQPVIISRSLAGKIWTLSWNAIPNASYYQVQVFDKNRTLVGMVQYTEDPTATITFTDLAAAPYCCQLIAWAVPGLNYNSAPTTITLRQLSAPSSISSHVGAAEVQCSFSPVTNATGYTASVLAGANHTVLATSSTGTVSGNPPQVTFSFDLALKASPEGYFIAVICTGGDQYISSNEIVIALPAIAETISVLIVVDAADALASRNLMNNTYLVDTNRYLGSWVEGTDDLHTVCQDGQVIDWSIMAVNPSSGVSIKGFSGPMVSNNICTPVARSAGSDKVWSGRVDSHGGLASYPYSVIVSVEGIPMPLSPYIKVV